MNSRKLLIGCGLVVIVGLGVFMIGMILASIPEADQQVPAGLGSSLVNINQPLNGAQLPLNQPVSVYVEAFGDQPLQDLQLLVDGEPQPGGLSSPAGDKKMIASWTFTPDKEGVHTLLARLNTRNGRTVLSNAVTVSFLPPGQVSIPLVLGNVNAPLVINAETSQIDLNAELQGGIPGSPPTGFNEQGDGVNPPPFITEPPKQESPAEPAQQPGGNLIPIKYLLWGQTLMEDLFSTELPAAPKLDGGSNQCDGILVVQDNSANELGFFLYRLDPGQQAFSRIATLDGKTGQAAFSYHDPGLALGKYLYYLAAFNAGGESASNIISITVDAVQCAVANKPKFDVESIPIDPGQPVDKAYCYGSAGEMPWVRLPYDRDTFIYAGNNKFDLAPYWDLIPLPQPTPLEVTLTMECWGWSGSTLVYLGTSSQTFELPGGPAPTPGPGGTLGEPPTYKVANPYNAEITNDPNVCKDHVPDLAYEQQCKNYMVTHGYLLVWTYNRFGDCNPQAEICDESYQPADGFNIYTVIEGKTTFYPIHPLTKHFSYVPAMVSNSKKTEFFVRAYSSAYGESGDSNHVLFPQPAPLETTINPTSLDIGSLEAYGDVSGPPQWYTYPPKGGELFSGYAFMPLSGSYRDVWATSTIYFTLPENIDIQGARLNWKNKSYTTYGPGADDVMKNCRILLKSGVGTSGWYQNLNTSLWGSENYDVSQAVLIAKMGGQSSINFWFEAPMGLKPGVRPDACLWYIDNVSLTLYHH